MRTAVRRVLAGSPRDSGLALPLVIGITAVLATLIVAGIALSVGALRASRDDQDWNGALAAAYAGIEEYESRLANDTGYWAYGNPASTYSNPTKSPKSSVALPPATATNPAFGLGTSGTWATVAGSDGSSQFRYEVDNSTYFADGTLRLRSTGRVGDETRTVVADLKQQGFIDFLYFTDYEVLDPQALNPTSKTNCEIRYPNSRSACTEIFFGPMDEIKGPLHTNDAIQTNGNASFEGKTTTSYQGKNGKNYVQKSGTTAPTFKFASQGDPVFSGTIGMPQTNSEIRKETRYDLKDDVPNPGCLYTGPTSITFHSNGTMTVVSPWTRETNTNEAGTLGEHPAKCGTPGSTGLGKMANGAYVGQTIDVPANLVVFAQDVPTDKSNVNYSDTKSSTTAQPGGPACSASGNNLGYPRANEVVPFAQAYGCRKGDIFVEGTLKGRATLTAENYVYVTGDQKYSDGGTEDMLGLVGQNAVWVYNPMNSSQKPLLNDSSRTIHAAILSVAHTFMVQNYSIGGKRGDLNVKGAIAQKFRGPVANTETDKWGTVSIKNGYAKKYVYDERFRNTAPPKFLSPVTTTYGINTWVEVEPAFDGSGNYR